MIRVLLIEDLALVRAGFRSIIESVVGMECIGEAADGEEGLNQVRQLRPDVVVCDLHLPGISGLEVTERIRRSWPECRVMIVTVQEEGPLPRRLLNAGAQGYVAKACPRDEFVKAIQDIARGRRYISVDIAQRLAFEPGDASPFDQLTPRELSVFKLLCSGKRGSQIAELLNLSPKTVSTHKSNIFLKLGISDLVSLIKLATTYGVLESQPEVASKLQA